MMTPQRKSTRKKRQTQLSFTPLPSSSPAVSQYPEQVQQRAASVRYDSDAASPTKKRRVGKDSFNKLASSPVGKSMFGGKNVQVVIESPSKKPGQLATPAASSQLEVNQADTGRDSSEDDLEILPEVKSKPRANVAEPKLDSTASMQNGQSLHDDSEEDIVPVRRARRKRTPPTTLSSDETSDPQTPQQLVTPNKRRGARPKVYTVGSETSESSEARIPTRKLRQELSISPQSQRTGHYDDKVSKCFNAAVSNKDESNVEEPVNISDGNDGSSSDDIVVTPARRRRSTAQILPSSQKSGEFPANDSEDLEEEVNDLQGSDTELRSTRTRGRQVNSARSIRQQKLEELKRRRAGLRDGSEEESEYSQSEDAYESGPEPIHHAMRRGGDLDEYEEDFVDDDDQTLGVELDAEALRRTIPIEFTRHANKKTIEHFKDEVEWMVHNKLNPAFKRHDEIYEVAHRKLDDEFKAYAGSKYISAVWNPEFDAALKSRPEIYVTPIPTMLEHKCDACRRANHPPKHKVTFAGQPYDRHTLEPTVHEDDDDSDESSSEGNDNPEDEQDFFLGRFCCANAEMAHALYHWRYALNQTVLEWLARAGHLTPEKIVERENMHQKKREKATNKVVDVMESTGVMKELYKEFKENLAAARDSKPTRFSR